MSGFSPAQLRKLTGKLERRHVHSRKVDGREFDYIEGWFALSEANDIFGFANWDRETAHFERIFERTRGEQTTCAYLARVRISVRAGDHTIAREGTGVGTASARSTADAHERAIKAAETDATKRALATFGNRFGLCLYDKEKNGVAGAKETASGPFRLVAPDGLVIASDLSPEAFCSGFRQLIERVDNADEIAACRDKNKLEIERLKLLAPGLRTASGAHYAEILKALIQRKIEARCPVTVETPTSPAIAAQDNGRLAPSKIANGPRIDKSTLEIGTPRRVRDKAHLRAVAALPCLACGAKPSHAHHLTFAQDRGLSLKASDEYVVPLCATHHNELHRLGAERSWWAQQGLDPLAVAFELWSKRGLRMAPSDNTSFDAITLAASQTTGAGSDRL